MDRSEVCTESLCFYCFDCVINALHPESAITIPAPSSTSHGLFVSWKTTQNDELAGCVGTFSPSSLDAGLKRYAIVSALRDDRFEPVSLMSIKSLNCSVSLLQPAVKCTRDSWIIGQHGITIKFTASGRQFGATFLPEIALEEGWDRDQTLLRAVRKSGYRGKITESFLNDIEIESYESIRVTASYEDYVAYKSQLEVS